MSELVTVARPYARAVFELAKETGRLPAWSEMLRLMAAVAQDPALRSLVDDPRLPSARASELFISVCGEGLDDQAVNLVRLLGEHHRLAAVPEIAALYERFRTEAEGKVEAEIITARELTDAQKKTLSEALKARLGRDVELDVKVDPTLLGGAIIRAGDLVIDGTIRNKLARLSTTLTR